MMSIRSRLILATVGPLAVMTTLPAEPVRSAPVAAAAKPVGMSRITVEVVGKGPDVVLIPGLSTPRAVWGPTAEALKGQYRLHLVQIRGFGDAPGANASGPVLEPAVEEIAAYIRSARLARPAIVGHSIGGTMTLALAERHPDLVGRAVVVDGLPYVATLFNPAATVEAVKPMIPQLRKMLARPAGKPAEAPPNMSGTEAGKAKVAEWINASDAAVSEQAMVDGLTMDLRPGLGAIKAPVRLIHAQSPMADSVFLPSYKGVSDFRATPIEGAQHFIMLDQPETFVAALRDALRN